MGDGYEGVGSGGVGEDIRRRPEVRGEESEKSFSFSSASDVHSPLVISLVISPTQPLLACDL